MPDQTLTDSLPIAAVEARFDSLLPGDEAGFATLRDAAVAYQKAHHPVYSRFAARLVDWPIPYLPVDAFKHALLHVCPDGGAPPLVFESSGTGRGVPSRHGVCRPSVYERSFIAHFRAVFGDGPFTFVAHLPHYESRGTASSLLYMVRGLIDRFGDKASGFFLEDDALLHQAVRHSRDTGSPLLLFGAAFGLLELAERRPPALPETSLIVETGGMKTFRREIDRATLHTRLAEAFEVPRERVWSEYGMCELLSQCYTRGGEVFYPPPWMRLAVVDPEDPRTRLPAGRAGALAVIDLANLYSVCAVLTQDRVVETDGGVVVLGRLTGAERRGCNFLLEQMV
jgi:hypothetical protein